MTLQSSLPHRGGEIGTQHNILGSVPRENGTEKWEVGLPWWYSG